MSEVELGPAEQHLLDEFAAGYSFRLDDYQLAACRELLGGHGVLVAAPTGAGKTVVGEFAAFLATQGSGGHKCFYTTPIKALSNQKYHDFVARYGAGAVGLLTGDISINGEAPIVVMTTEVLRNMIYAASETLSGLGYVVLDEVHYLADRFRGAVWEEVILGLSDAVQVVALSATVSNAEEFGAWLDEVRPKVSVIVSEDRTVPLFQHVMAARELHDLYDASGRALNPKLQAIAVLESKRSNPRGGRRRRTGSPFGHTTRPRGDHHNPNKPNRSLTPSRSGVVIGLRNANLLPAIVFIFSRAGCDGAVRQVLGSKIKLTTSAEQEALREIAERHGAALSATERRAIGWDVFCAALEAGIAAHHAGLLPVCKAIVEEAFTRGLLKVVYATETLALGINMPARTVVIERLVKFNGEAHADLTPGEFTQLTGRAGRRGIDTEGHAVVLWQTGMQPKAVANLAARRTYPLNSSFAPTYNMAVNLVATIGRARARTLLAHSFAQFQADRHPRGAHEQRTGVLTIAEQFDRVCAVLGALNYLTPGDELTDAGTMLRRIYNELDLVVAEAIAQDTFAGLDEPQLASVLSTLVFESRGGGASNAWLPDEPSSGAYGQLRRIHRAVARIEREQRVATPARDLDPGFAAAAYAWASGDDLTDVLGRSRLAPGDFVRWIRQVIDLAAQISAAPGVGPLRVVAQSVVSKLRRGIVDFDD